MLVFSRGRRRCELVRPVDPVMAAICTRAYVRICQANLDAVVDGPSRAVLAFVLVGKPARRLKLSVDGGRPQVANGLADDGTAIKIQALVPIASIAVGRGLYDCVRDEP